VAHGIKNGPSNKEVQELLAKTQNELRAHLTMEQLQVHPHIEPWIIAYKKFGAKPKSHIPSVKNLAERVLKGSLPSITTLVDLYNIISLNIYCLPAEKI